MTNRERYDSVFESCFDIRLDEVGRDLRYDSIPVWNSIGHMSLMEAMEDAFGLMLDTEDILEFNAYEKGPGVLKKYGVDLED